LKNRQDGHRKRVETLKKKAAKRHQAEQRALEEAQVKQRELLEQQAWAKENHRISTLNHILLALIQDLNTHKLDLGDLLVYTFDPAAELGTLRWKQFWRRPESFSQLMRHWTSKGATQSGRKLVKDFAIDLVTRIMRQEAQNVTQAGVLQSSFIDISTQGTEEFILDMIGSQLRNYCSITTEILSNACTSSAQRRNPTKAAKHRKDKVCNGLFNYIED
jgi:hypothetical protein